MKPIFILFVAIGAITVSCTNFPMQRHPGSGYSGYTGQASGEVSLADLAEKDRTQQKTIRVAPSVEKKMTPQEKNRFNRAVASLVEQNDITIGMDMQAVRESWGFPDDVLMTGQEKHLNQIWKYSIPVQTPHDYYIEERIVKFQNGRVVGWESK